MSSNEEFFGPADEPRIIPLSHEEVLELVDKLRSLNPSAKEFEFEIIQADGTYSEFCVNGLKRGAAQNLVEQLNPGSIVAFRQKRHASWLHRFLDLK